MSIDPVPHRGGPEYVARPLPWTIVLVLATMFSLGIAAITMAGSARDADLALPRLDVELGRAVEPGTVSIGGTHFTAGGDVLIAVYEEWGDAPSETRQVTASDQTLASSASDPGLKFHPGGVIHASFQLACGQAVLAQALDIETGIRSNTIDLDVECGA